MHFLQKEGMYATDNSETCVLRILEDVAQMGLEALKCSFSLFAFHSTVLISYNRGKPH
jgi:hypothetical protein